MDRARTRIRVVAGPGRRPEGWDAVVGRHAAATGVELSHAEAVSTEDLVAAVADAGRASDAIVLSAPDHVGDESVARAVATCLVPVVWAHPELAGELAAVPAACTHAIHGRGRRSYSGALRWLVTRLTAPPTTLPYGAHEEQVGDLRLPDDRRGRRAPVIVLLHGGFWREPWQRDLMDEPAVALARDGWATWNLEYRRVGRSGGGWPATLADACAGLDAVALLADDHALDPDRVVVVGHSAGAQLAMYAAARPRLRRDAPGAVPGVRPRAIASLAGVLDLDAARRDGLGDDAVAAFLGPDGATPTRVATTSPHRLLPLGVPLLLVHGHDDALVPSAQSASLAAAATRAGDEVVLRLVDTDHFGIVAARGPAYEELVAWLEGVGGLPLEDS